VKTAAYIRPERFDPEYCLQTESTACYLCRAPDPDVLGRKSDRDVTRCSTCGLVSVRPLPDEAELERYYRDGFWQDYHARPGNPGLEEKFRLDRFLAQGRLREIRRWHPRGRLLDVGCSYGALVLEARAMGYEAVGCDLSPEAVLYGRARHGLDLRTGPLPNPDLDAESFEIITLIDLIEHFRDPAAELQALLPLLGPGGVLVIETPDVDNPRFRTDPLSWWAVEPLEHLFLFDRPNLTGLLEGIGLAVDWLGYPAFSDRLFLVCRRAGEEAWFQPRPETVLVKREGMMGDVLWAGPVIRSLKASRPDARIHVATGVPEILAGHPDIEGINDLPVNYIYDRRLEFYYEYAPDRHILSGYAESAGLPDMEADPEIFLTAGEVWDADHRLAEIRPGPGPLIALHAGVSWPERTWDWFFWDRLALELTARLGADVLVLGKSPDFELTPWPGLHNQVDLLGIREMAALMSRADLFVGLDSGPMHVAAALGLPVVALFGCIEPAWRRPFRPIFEPVTTDLACSGCQARRPIPSFDGRCENGAYRCMKEIRPGQVFEAVLRALGRAGLPADARPLVSGLAEAAGRADPLSAGPGFSLHSRIDPVQEAADWVEHVRPTGDLVVLGLGLGFHVSALLDDPRFRGRVVVVEKDPDRFRQALASGLPAEAAADDRVFFICGQDPALALLRIKTLGLDPGLRAVPHRASLRLAPAYYRVLFDALRRMGAERK